jgi:type IV pili sensor histidine kinase/response regulator
VLVKQINRKIKRFLILGILGAVSLLVANIATAYPLGKRDIKIGRYLTMARHPLKAQQDLLSQTIQVRFSRNVKTIGQAMRYLLQYSGYSMCSIKKQPKTVREMLNLPLPLVDRQLGPITLREALRVLVGCSFKLIVDPVHRIISFKLRNKYKYYE